MGKTSTITLILKPIPRRDGAPIPMPFPISVLITIPSLTAIVHILHHSLSYPNPSLYYTVYRPTHTLQK